MADVLMIAGKPETIFKARDFEYLVEKYMGYEAAKVLDTLFGGLADLLKTI